MLEEFWNTKISSEWVEVCWCDANAPGTDFRRENAFFVNLGVMPRHLWLIFDALLNNNHLNFKMEFATLLVKRSNCYKETFTCINFVQRRITLPIALFHVTFKYEKFLKFYHSLYGINRYNKQLIFPESKYCNISTFPAGSVHCRLPPQIISSFLII